MIRGRPGGLLLPANGTIRRRGGLPPFGRLAGIVVSATDRQAALDHARGMARAGPARGWHRRRAAARAGRGAAGADPRPLRFRLLVQDPIRAACTPGCAGGWRPARSRAAACGSRSISIPRASVAGGPQTRDFRQTAAAAAATNDRHAAAHRYCAPPDPVLDDPRPEDGGCGRRSTARVWIAPGTPFQTVWQAGAAIKRRTKRRVTDQTSPVSGVG